ncbi:hypothetical protein RU95_GL003538 [Enterococcus avium]|nr:hypothetical protein RU95_GL003538 [Enterococcus avium]
MSKEFLLINLNELILQGKFHSISNVESVFSLKQEELIKVERTSVALS